MTERTMYMIKPEAMDKRDDIHKMIVERHLSIACFKSIVMSENLVKELYYDSPTRVQRAQIKLFNHTDVELGIVTGTNAIDRLLHTTGLYADPSMCQPESIRAKYGHPVPVVIDEVELFQNAIHRPKNIYEAERHVDVAARILNFEPS